MLHIIHSPSGRELIVDVNSHLCMVDNKNSSAIRTIGRKARDVCKGVLLIDNLCSRIAAFFSIRISLAAFRKTVPVYIYNICIYTHTYIDILYTIITSVVYCTNSTRLLSSVLKSSLRWVRNGYRGKVIEKHTLKRNENRSSS